MSLPDRIEMPFRSACAMLRTYAATKLMDQIKAVAFIIVYLVAFKIIILKEPPTDALQISFGIGLVIFGLAFFLEGLFLGLMPLGERVGILLPKRTNIYVIMIFGVILGLAATYAEPAITALRLAGSTTTPWDSPLLYRFLEAEPDKLILSIGWGVGVAVAFGMARFYFGLSIKLFIYTLVPLLLGITAWFLRDPNLAKIVSLAWDTGVVTTGPVTVPLVLAMGIGISQSDGKQESGAGSSGFGVVTLAALFPVLVMFISSYILSPSTPEPISIEKFFAQENRENAFKLVPTEDALMRIAFQRGNEAARKAYFNDEEKYFATLSKLADPEECSKILGEMSLSDWLTRNASSAERSRLALDLVGKNGVSKQSGVDVHEVLAGETSLAFKAVVSLVSLLFVVLFFFLKGRLRHLDEFIIGILFTLVGMAILTSGIRLGLAPLGDQVGRPLPQVFRTETHEEGRIILEPFDESMVSTVFSSNGVPEKFLFITEDSGKLKRVNYDEKQFNAETGRYEHIVERPPLFGPDMTLLGIIIVFLFAFGMGYGLTVAEPTLSAMGVTVEETTAGILKKDGVVKTVSLGVGVGLMVGVARLLYSIPLLWLLLGSYAVLLTLTWFSDEDFAGIAWDSGGVTTGPITVPLVLSMGLGIGGELNVVDGFGIVAMTCIFPILTMLIYGISMKTKQRYILEGATGGDSND